MTNPVGSAAGNTGNLGSISLGGSVVVDFVYASLPTGSVPKGERIVFRTRETGAETAAVLVDGGFDPIAIPATVGDTLDVRLYLVDQTEPEESISVVPERRPPVLVRVDPTPGRRDVPLNVVLLLVFSEPIDAATLTPSSVSLSRGSAPVAGSLAFGDPANLTVTFTPAEPLVAATEYTLLVTQAIEDRDGDALTAPATVGFTTEAPVDQPDPAVPLPISSNQIVFVRGSDIFLMDDDGANPVRLTSTSWEYYSPALSPEGTRIAFVEDYSGFGSDIFTMYLDGSGLTNVTNGQFGDQAAQPAWSPDGGRIVFTSDREGSFAIYVMNADGSGLTRLTSGSSTHWSPSWSPDGSRILFERDEEVFVMNADGSEQVNLTNHPGLDGKPSWSPDATRILFHAYRDGNSDIYVMNADGSRQTNLTNSAGLDFDPSWSPGGNRVVFGRQLDEDTDVYVMNADGSGQTNLTPGPGWARPGSPQGWR